MKRNRVQDERVAMQKQRITSEAFSFLMLFLIGATLVKQFVFQAEFREYAVEFIAFFGGCFYIVLRNIFAGNNLFEGNRKNVAIINSVIISVTVTAVTGFLHFKDFQSTSDFLIELVIAFVSSIIAVLLFYYILNKVTQRRIKTIEKRFEEEEDEVK